jgi:acyl carrier protein
LLDRSAEDIDPAADFGDYGLDSADAVMLAGALEEILDREVEPTILLRHRSLAGLIDELAAAGMVS